MLARDSTEPLTFRMINNNRVLYYVEQVPEMSDNVISRRYRLNTNMAIETGIFEY